VTSAVTFTPGAGESGDIFEMMMKILRSDAAGQALQDHLNLSPIPAGVVTAWAGDTTKTATIPGGWLPCDGRSVSRQTYAALFRVIGVAYGQGNGVSSFRLPDLRDRFPMGASATNARGFAGGEVAHTLTVNEMPVHSHTIQDPGHNHAAFINFNTGTHSSLTWAGGTFNDPDLNPIGNAQTGITIDNAGGGLSHNNIPPYQTLNFLIKT
jgi:microcystin-dependent protein